MNKKLKETIDNVFKPYYRSTLDTNIATINANCKAGIITEEQNKEMLLQVQKETLKESIDIASMSKPEIAKNKEIVYKVIEAMQQSNKAVYSELMEDNYNTSDSKKRFIHKKFAEKKKNKAKTGFKQLDNELSGGINAGLCILGALSSLGKTSLAVQLCDQLADQGNEVIFYTREQPIQDLIAKSLCRLGNLSFQELEDIETEADDNTCTKYANAWTQYDKLGNKIQTKDIGLGWDKTIRHDIQQVKQKNDNQPPFIFIDYLQLLPALSPKNATDKQKTDEAIDTLKQIIKDENCFIFVISSLNRESYNQPINLSSFKESGSIEYTAELILGMQPHRQATINTPEGIKDIYTERNGYNPNNVNSWKNQEIKTVELTILKNRNGKSGGTVNLEFNSKFFSFKEVTTTQTHYKKAIQKPKL